MASDILPRSRQLENQLKNSSTPNGGETWRRNNIILYIYIYIISLSHMESLNISYWVVAPKLFFNFIHETNGFDSDRIHSCASYTRPTSDLKNLPPSKLYTKVTRGAFC